MPVKIIQVGLGGWGRNWYRAYLANSSRISVVASVDSSPEALEAARAELGIPENRCHRSLGDALAATDAAAVLITANLPAHVPVAKAALEAGLHVLTEKPFAPSLREGEKLVELAARKNLVLMVSQNYRFYPAVRTVEATLAAGKLGTPTTISLCFRKYANAAEKAGHRHYSLNHPMLTDMAIHHFDLMRLIVKARAVEVYCRTTNPSWSNFSGPPAAFGIITFENGVSLSYRGSWISHREDTSWAGSWAVECEKGALEWESRRSETATEDRVTVTKLGKNPAQMALKPVKQLDRAGSLDTFLRAMRSGEEPECSGRDNIGTLELMFAMVKSAESGKPVRLPPSSY
jgi:predicted dehydrogenase